MNIDKVINVDVFIAEVEKRPFLWNQKDGFYKDRTKKRQAWKEICRILFLDFESMPEDAKESISYKLATKWKNIKDYHFKCLRRDRESKSGRCRYVYANQLSFLANAEEGLESDLANGSTAMSDSTQNLSSEGECEPLTTVSKLNVQSEERQYDNFVLKRKNPTIQMRFEPLQQQQQYAEKACIRESPISFAYADSPDPDKEDRAFFESLLPSLRTLNTDEKLEFRVEVMQMVKKIRQSRVSKEANRKSSEWRERTASK